MEGSCIEKQMNMSKSRKPHQDKGHLGVAYSDCYETQRETS